MYDMGGYFLPSDITALVKDKAYAGINLDEFSIHQVIFSFLYYYGGCICHLSWNIGLIRWSFKLSIRRRWRVCFALFETELDNSNMPFPMLLEPESTWIVRADKWDVDNLMNVNTTPLTRVNTNVTLILIWSRWLLRLIAILFGFICQQKF